MKARPSSSGRKQVEKILDVVPFLIPTSMWDLLSMQAEEENCMPGEVLDRALSEYLEANGSQEVLAAVESLKKGY